MMAEFNKSHERTSQFFASNKFREFKEDLDPMLHNAPFVDLSFKCCGYGYFPIYKERMLKNFISYLVESVRECHELVSLKIVFNGFDVNDGSIKRICNAIGPALEGPALERRKLRSLCIHTNNLRHCRKDDFVDLFNLIDQAGMEIACEEISVQMSDWEFQGGYPSYNQLVTIFGQFFENIVHSLKFKKFRLEISSWYMKDKQAYNFLKDTLSNEKIKGYFESSRNDGNAEVPNRTSAVSRLKQQEKQSVLKALDYFLQNMDRKYLQPNYPHKKSSQRYNEQEKNEHDEMIKRMNDDEQTISKIIKYPNEYIMQLKVEEFHKQMTTFLGGVLYKLPQIQEYHIDMRNWHSMFGMANLKKQLDTKVNSKQEFSLIRRSLGLASKAIGKMAMEGEEVGLKTIYTM